MPAHHIDDLQPIGGAPHAPPRSTRRIRRWLLPLTVAVVGATVVIALAVLSVLPRSPALLKQRIVDTLSDRLDGDVDVADVRLRFLPRYRVELLDLVITQRQRQGVPPLIHVKRIIATGDWLALLRKHVSNVTLEGLEISIPPSASADGDSGDSARRRSGDHRPFDKDVVVDRLVSTGARLSIIPGAKGKRPKIWEIRDLEMRSVTLDQAMPFRANLTNAVPPGEIATQGVFGPWQVANPSATKVTGTFTLAQANLSVFKGISGMASAIGAFGGSLARIGVHGETDVPHFTVTIGGHPVALHADYDATVDGTNGNTVLDRIDASFLKTSLVAKGGVIGGPGKEGRTVTLDVVIKSGRTEDVLRLTVKSTTPPISGGLTLSTKLVIPPGDRDVVDKLRLDGQFSIGTARFANFDVQDKVNMLSQRGRGEASTDPRPGVASNVVGRFRLANGTLALQTLKFDVPGAGVLLAGTYALRPEHLELRGALELDAKMSETQRGWKRLVLKALDPIFEKKGGGGTYLPIRIDGPWRDPSFGIDKAALFRRGNAVKRSSTPRRP